MTRPLTVWALTEGHIGMENQALGVAEALVGAGSGTVVVKRIAVRPPWRWLPAGAWPAPLLAVGSGGDLLAPPWPDVVISCGKRAVAPNAAIRRRTRGATLAVHIQQPHVPADRFDLIVVPQHDDLRAPNVLVTRAAVHRVTAERLAQGGAAARASVGNGRQAVTVLIGGSNNRHRLTAAIATRLGDQLAALCTGGSIQLRITPSRRTDPAMIAILKDKLAGTDAEIWDGSGDNPYFDWLALADTVLVTWDSVSMTSEALATGKPVYVVPMEGASRRIDRFQRQLETDGYTRTFAGALDRWSYAPPDDTAAAAARIQSLLAARDDPSAIDEGQ